MAASLRINNVGQLGPGDNVLVGWAGIDNPHHDDWVGVWEQGVQDKLDQAATQAVVWKTTDGLASGNTFLPLPAAIKPGSYEVRLYCCGGYNLLAQIPMQVVSPIVAAPAPGVPAPAPSALPALGIDPTQLLRNPIVLAAGLFFVASMLRRR